MGRNMRPITVTDATAQRIANAARWCCVLVLLAMMIEAGFALRDEISVAQANTCLGEAIAGQAEPDCPTSTALPPRAALAIAHADLAKAAQATGRMRTIWLQRAVPMLVRTRTRPHWGEADVAEAYFDLLAKGATDPATINAYAQSYRDAPYLHDAVLWRVRFGTMAWSVLSTATRRAMLDEAGSYAEGGTGPRALIGLIVTGSGAETAFANHQNRVGASPG